MDVDEEFWINRPINLITGLTIIPTRNMHFNQLLNTITRLIIVITVLLLIFGLKDWWAFFLLGMILVLALWSINGEKPATRIEHFRCRPQATSTKKQSRVKNVRLMGEPIYNRSSRYS